LPELAVIAPAKRVAELRRLVVMLPTAALPPNSVEALTVPVEIRLAFRLAVLTEAARRSPVAWNVLVRMLLVLVMFPVLRVVNPPITPDKEFVAIRLTQLISFASLISLLSQSIVEIAGVYAQSAIDERLLSVAIGAPLRSSVAPNPDPPVSNVLPSSVMLVVLIDDR
jgi:hypothetical protein